MTSISDCRVCEHPLIDHGWGEDYPCDCCSGKAWNKANDPHAIIPKKSGKFDGRIPRGFVVVKDFPDYCINRRGTVQHIATKKLCLFMRLSEDGSALVMVLKNKRAHVVSVQDLIDKSFSRKIEKGDYLAG